MTTYRDRRAAKADRLRGWAEGREAKADAAETTARERASVIPLGQPILVGHHSEGRDRRYRDSISRGFDRAREHSDKAADMRRRADSIDAAAERSIYNDDPDAVERLQERIAEAEAERDRIKAYNKSCRKGTPDPELIDEAQRRNLASCANAGQLRPDGSFPAYVTSNIGGRIAGDRKRLAALTSDA